MKSTRFEEGLKRKYGTVGVFRFPEGLQPEGLQPEPMFRYHCLACSEVTLAPRGQATVACKRCGAEVGDASRTLDEIRVNLERLQGMLQVRQGFEDYARADAEVTVHMVRMSKELALATLYLKVTDPRTSDSKGS